MSAFRKLSLRYHPDKTGDSNHELFLKLSEAKDYCLKILEDGVRSMPLPSGPTQQEREAAEAALRRRMRMQAQTNAAWEALSEEDKELGRTPFTYKPNIFSRIWHANKYSPAKLAAAAAKKQKQAERERRAQEKVMAEALRFTQMQAEARAKGARC